MITDTYIIFLTAFALFGAYCLAEDIFMAFRFEKMPQSVTIMAYKDDMLNKAYTEYIHSTLNNNHVIFLAENQSFIAKDENIVYVGEISQYLTNALFTKADN